MEDVENKMGWAAANMSAWRIDINSTGFLEWINENGYPVEEVVKLPDDWDGEDEDLALFNMAIENAMEK